ncbi:MAG: acyl-CoA dehydrogenase family protein [Cellvibrio sp.]|uniref:acyl-CoA dehydrogenase family protein n=1 Tax=Cellvibrio sp. TaxID=1965322 RepID=UPI002717C8F1|nr:acyl-CoA dehydrogenase family protein [Cellvibrio sp.]
MKPLVDITVVAEERFGDFIRTQINPDVLKRDHHGESLSADIFFKACVMGMTSFGLPKEIGGSGNSPLLWGKMLEQIGYLSSDSSFPLVVSLRAGLINTLYRSGKEDIIKKYVKPMVFGERAPAFAYTDGTDPFSFKTQAKKVEGGYLLSGEKLYVTGGVTADTFMLYARCNDSGFDDLKVFIVEKDDAGFSRIPSDLSGLRSAGICSLLLNDVYVPEDRVLVTQDGLSHVQQFLNERRVFLVCPLLGRMQAILEDCITDLEAKQRYGNSLTAMQHVQAQIGRMFQLLELSRSVLYRALERQSSPDFDTYWDSIGSTAKLTVIENGIELIQIAQKLLGGDGYLRSKHYERYMRDFCGYIPGGGSQETLVVDLGINAITSYDLKLKTKLLMGLHNSSPSQHQGDEDREHFLQQTA